MKSYDKLNNSIEKSGSILCVGLDADIDKLPLGVERNLEGLLSFNREIISACAISASSFKINFAFYEQYGVNGFDVLLKTIEEIPKDKFIIADAKRGDIGNTSKAYAKSAFDFFNADSITVSPYMGSDSIIPFLEYKDKMVFILALTSNPGSADFQRLVSDGEPLYKHVIKKSISFGSTDSIGFVVGATHPEELEDIRQMIPENYLLIPGVGTQGGDIEAIIKANNNCPAIINVSRDVIYSSSGENYAEKASEKAEFYKKRFSNE